MLAFQQGLNGTPDEYDPEGFGRSASEPYDSRMDDNNDEQAVAEYMRSCRYARASLHPLQVLLSRCPSVLSWITVSVLQGANAYRAH